MPSTLIKSGGYNTALGEAALLNNTAGGSNTAIGWAAGLDTTGSSNILINNPGLGGENNTIRIGSGVQTATYIAGIAGRTVGAGGTTCYVNNLGKLGVLLSARRYKQDIRAMDETSKGLLSLRPVTFRYKLECGDENIPQFGLVAEEVAEVNPDLVTRDAKGQIATVRYEAVNAMLLNEFLKEHRKNEEQQATIAMLKSTVEKQQATNAQQQKQIEALTAGLQKVSAQLELSKSAPQTVKNTD
jgi:endosialidase-like protein